MTQELIDRRRAQILTAARRVFARQGFHRTTVREVAREAGLADGTIYLYFANKQDLLLALLGQLGRVGERRADFAGLAGMDARASMESYLRRRLEDLRAWRELFMAVFPEVLADPGLRAAQAAQTVPAFEAAEAELARRMESGELRALDPALLARAEAATALGLLVLDILGDRVVDNRWGELPSLLTSLWFEGLRPEGR
ncbi:MAG: TetR/AcrR family transcriptional regulator [Candidatus Dormibacteraeota bacterium]|nr:TetR/AcrR family transcriptional regulator [Candidatus Dormibacteraeota bacterium]